MLRAFLKRMSLKWHLAFLLFFFLCSGVSSQEEYRIDGDYNRDSRSLVLALNTNGYRLGFRFSKRVDGFRSRLLDIDLAWYRHYKEKSLSFSSVTNSRYTYGKLNQLLLLRTSIGREKELYGKYAKSGVAVLFTYNVGASVGLLKPYYLINNEGDNVLFKDMEVPSTGQITQRAPFFKGFEESKFAFGGHIQAVFGFNVNKKHQGISRLELGATFDIFHRKLPILSEVEQYQYIVTLFLAYRFGTKTTSAIN